MSTVALRASLALWRRRHAFRQRRLDAAHVRNDRAAVEKWHRLLADAGRMIRRRTAQLAHPKPKPQSVRARTLAHAATFVGTTEQPPGSNRGPLISEWATRIGFPGGGVPWCGIFCGNMLLHAGVIGVTSRIAAVSLIEADARSHRGCFRGWTTATRGVLPGDLVVLFGPGVHVAMVRKIADGVVYTVEGNTSSGDAGSQSNGGGVFLRVRPMSAVYGFALVNYPG